MYARRKGKGPSQQLYYFGAQPRLEHVWQFVILFDWLYRKPQTPIQMSKACSRPLAGKDWMRFDQSQLENASEIKSAAGRRQRVSVLQMELVNCHPWSIGDGISITCNVHSTSHVRGVEVGWKISETACNRNFALLST